MSVMKLLKFSVLLPTVIVVVVVLVAHVFHVVVLNQGEIEFWTEVIVVLLAVVLQVVLETTVRTTKSLLRCKAL